MADLRKSETQVASVVSGRLDWHWRVSRKRNVWKFNINIEQVEIADLLIYLLKIFKNGDFPFLY